MLPVVPRIAVPRDRPNVWRPLQLCPCQMIVLPPSNSNVASCVSGNSQSSCEVIPAAGGRHARWIVDAERQARDVDLVRAVVADLAGSPPLEPVPVVVHDVVAIRRARRRSLPQLVIQGWTARAPACRARSRARVGVPGAHEIRASDRAVLDRLERLDRSRRRALLRAHLHDAPVFLLRFDQQLAFARIVSARLLEVDVLARLHREHRHRRVPVIRRGDRRRRPQPCRRARDENRRSPFGALRLRVLRLLEHFAEHRASRRRRGTRLRCSCSARSSAREHCPRPFTPITADDDLVVRGRHRGATPASRLVIMTPSPVADALLRKSRRSTVSLASSER